VVDGAFDVTRVGNIDSYWQGAILAADASHFGRALFQPGLVEVK
jgi:hypothetical protein